MLQLIYHEYVLFFSVLPFWSAIFSEFKIVQ